MEGRIWILIGCLVLGVGSMASAQVLSPKLVCVAGNTLTWQPVPVAACGAFTYYEVWGKVASSTNPFSRIDTVTNRNQNTYMHMGAGSATWLYYLRAVYACTNGISTPSDTLDNLTPLNGSLARISVTPDNRAVRLEWSKSPSPETEAYVIYRNTTSGTSIIDTVSNDSLAYTDINANPNAQSETYYVVASDACGNLGLIETAHSTLFLRAETSNACDRRVRLTWSAYQGWASGVETHDIWLSLGGSAPLLVGTVNGNVRQYDYPVTTSGVEHCFYVVAKQTGQPITSRSNAVCSTPVITTPVRSLVLESVSWLSETELEATWRWNPDAQLDGMRLLQTQGQNTPKEVQLITDATILKAGVYKARFTASAGNLVCLFVESLDACGAITTSNQACAIALRASAFDDKSVTLRWTNFVNSQVNGITYDVYRVVDGTAEFITSTADTTYVDNSPQGGSQFCYRITANATIVYPDGTRSVVAANSNIACVQPESRVYIPNAFSPTGQQNAVFQPVVLAKSVQNYRLMVFNRWGEPVFLSNSPDASWDGTWKGGDAAAGMYIYVLSFTDDQGQRFQKQGELYLLR